MTDYLMPTNYADAQAMMAYAQAQMQNQYPTQSDFNEGIVDYLVGNAPSSEFQEFLYANLDQEKLYLPNRLDATGSVLGDYVFGLGGAAASDLSRYLVSQDVGSVLDD